MISIKKVVDTTNTTVLYFKEIYAAEFSAARPGNLNSTRAEIWNMQGFFSPDKSGLTNKTFDQNKFWEKKESLLVLRSQPLFYAFTCSFQCCRFRELGKNTRGFSPSPFHRFRKPLKRGHLNVSRTIFCPKPPKCISVDADKIQVRENANLTSGIS